MVTNMPVYMCEKNSMFVYIRVLNFVDVANLENLLPSKITQFTVCFTQLLFQKNLARARSLNPKISCDHC